MLSLTCSYLVVTHYQHVGLLVDTPTNEDASPYFLEYLETYFCFDFFLVRVAEVLGGPTSSNPTFIFINPT